MQADDELNDVMIVPPRAEQTVRKYRKQQSIASSSESRISPAQPSKPATCLHDFS